MDAVAETVAEEALDDTAKELPDVDDFNDEFTEPAWSTAGNTGDLSVDPEAGAGTDLTRSASR